ncbi:MAG: DUF2845 domain-containing protein [Desulfovibrionales bacterium]
MISKRTICVFCSLLGMILSFIAFRPEAVHAFRCGNELIRQGDTRLFVLKHCGEPADRLAYVVEKKRNHTVIKVFMEEWTYNLGPQEFLYILTFANGRVQDITTGGYGFPTR